ncbi:hypothetical protein NIES593_15270 [Hydrococcus rivularis NIES-593]|uniref:TauD/TfdA-like domain-containing protein n=1 Tax=Hydrococcus rivularis NIES-593 TaxID=1921803 RepID=A0A1U7HDF6_9CYAN|nr:TauD/TfdA family dioxygenase [Hydrococcus rivularis]OKH21575.1 hypothetical protein NIES593_15270 [Hydrococcus rivularis NIES-593]
MLFHKEDLAPGIGRFAFSDIWNKIGLKITETIDEFYDKPVAKGFYPHFNEITFRQAVLSVSAELKALQENLKQLLSDRYCAIFLDRTHLCSFSEIDRNKLLYALSLALGYPTPTDPRIGKLLWDVKPRYLPAGYFATYSEHSDRADLHTDTQYYLRPEKYFLLYVVRAARCGGGKSLICDSREVKNRLLETEQGRKAYETLSTFKFPFRIPTTFTEAGTIGSVKTTLAPIFSNEPFIRFRYDTLEKGFQSRRDLDVPEARNALKVLLDVLENKANVVEYYMSDDALAICNNHVALHGRTSFQDRDRHLIRVRMSSQPVVSKPTLLATA